MPRPKFFRDPLHLQIRYDAVDLGGAFPSGGPAATQASWLVRRLVDCSEVQRLRHIRQNGLTNLVFHGAEHSRFTHSMGVAHLAREMYASIQRNSDVPRDSDHEVLTCVAALLHDVGHGPFSHTLEEILKSDGVDFDHEVMTQRLIEEEDSEIHKVLKSADPRFPAEIAYYINKRKRRETGQKEHWRYRLVSSQLDADRLDYLLRDSLFAGLKGGFDIARLLDSLLVLDPERIAVDRRSMVTVEAYLVMLDQIYRAVYYHHTTRAASVLLSGVVRRAFSLHRKGDTAVFSGGGAGVHPLQALADQGQRIRLRDYTRLSEFHVWSLIEGWQHHDDPALADLSRRLLRRKLFKTIDVDPEQHNRLASLKDHAKQVAKRELSWLNDESVDLYVSVDEPDRTSYKRYDWRSEASDESIWLMGGQRKPAPIEEDQGSKIVQGLKETKYFHRLVVPEEVKQALLRERPADLAKLQGGKGS